jgi:hypothetical protein
MGTADWERLLWQARAAELMAQLQAALAAARVLDRAPAGARRHLEIARAIAERHAQAVRHELLGLAEVLSPLGVPVLLLKGAGYAALGHPASRGRIFNDVDIMVPKAALPDVERVLHWAGWFPQHTTAYDERYYREWMHEIPPLSHKNRATVLDVHHTILPPTSGIVPDPAGLFEQALPLAADWAPFSVLSAPDRVLHSACHLFFGEFHKGLRDLFDLHRLLSHDGTQPGFWDRLAARAVELRLALPLQDALEQCQRVYATEVPTSVLAALRPAARSPWPRWTRRWLFEHALRPAHRSAFGPTTGLALRAVFVRSHWLRMPVPLLVRHLSHKAFVAR